MFNEGTLTTPIVAGNVMQKLAALRKAFDDIQDLYRWTSGVAVADLVGLGFTSVGATALLTAVSDANAEAQIHLTGLPPATYPQPASAYVYGASQAQVIGPQ